jgi:methyl-accepting chemotaxis protein
MEYIIFVGASILGVALGMVSIIAKFKRGLSVRMNWALCLLCALFANAGFILGHLGVTWLNVTLTLLVLIPITVALVFSLLKQIVNPIKEIDAYISNLTAGNLQDRLQLDAHDELKELGDNLNLFIGSLADYTATARQVANGNLNINVMPKSTKDILGMAFAEMVSNLRGTIENVTKDAQRLQKSSTQLAENARQAGLASSQIATTIQQVAVGTTQQSDSVTKTAVSIEAMSRAITGVAQGAHEQSLSVSKAVEITDELNKAIKQVTTNAEKVKYESEKADEAASAGSQTVRDTLVGMERIRVKVEQSAVKVQEMGQKSEKIGSIVEAIEEISSQTNLLALNAAIEAARAGEAGKGFAVVADEVRKLADKTSVQAREIANLVKTIQVTVNEAVDSMEEGTKEVETGVIMANTAGHALEKIQGAIQTVNNQAVESSKAAEAMRLSSSQLVESVTSVSAVVEENTAATEEMAASSSVVNQAIEDIASISEQNSAAVEQVSASAEEMSDQVEEVSQSVKELADMATSLQRTIAHFNLGM